MRKLSDFYKSGASRTKLIRRVRSMTFIEIGDGVYDVLGDVEFSDLELDSLLEVVALLKELTSSEAPVRIRKVYGSFRCNYNHLQTLQGAPEEVYRNFCCAYNQLITLEGAPKRVGGSFHCEHTTIQTLQGAPEYVGGDFICFYTKLVSLEGAPKYVGGNFLCYGNPRKFTEEEVRKLVNVIGEVNV